MVFRIRRIHIDGGDSIYAEEESHTAIRQEWKAIEENLRVNRKVVRDSGVVRYVLDTPLARASLSQDV